MAARKQKKPAKTSTRPRAKAAAAKTAAPRSGGTRQWIVTATGTRAIADVARDLRAAGLTVGAVLDAVGSITGSASASAVAKMRKVEGVADVAADAPIDIGPPGSDETW